MKPSLHTSSHSIVLLGDFNPKIFQPAWFACEGLVGKNEAEAAEIEVIHAEVVVFAFQGFKLQVTRDRFIISSLQEPYFAPMRDLVLGTFELLRHTPVNRMGINVERHYRVHTEEEWHSFGHKLTPKQIWNGILEEPGMRSVVIQGKRKDSYNGWVLMRVDPSPAVQPGVFFQVNDHLELDHGHSSPELMEILRTSWRDSVKRSVGMIESLVEEIG